MNFIGIDPHTNRFTRCYWDKRRWDNLKGKLMKTFDLTAEGQAAFYATQTEDISVLVEAAITTCSFVRLFKDKVREVIIANPYVLKQITLARNNTDKIDTDKLCRTLKARIFSGARQIAPVILPLVGNPGITKPVQRLSVIQETGDPTQESYPLAPERTVIQVHLGRTS